MPSDTIQEMASRRSRLDRRRVCVARTEMEFAGTSKKLAKDAWRRNAFHVTSRLHRLLDLRLCRARQLQGHGTCKSNTALQRKAEPVMTAT